MSDYVTELECDECGDVAISTPDGIWTDGDECICRCGVHWMVTLDEEMTDVWLNPVAP